MDFHNFYNIYVLKVKESIADIPIELRCSSDLKNPSKLPVREVLIILSYKLLKFSTIHVFEFRESIADISAELPCLSYTSKIPVNFRFKGTSKVLIIVAYGFSQFLHYLCSRGQEIHC